MTILTEGRHVGEFLVSEAEGTLSREEVTVTQAGAPIVSGTVLGKITASGKYVPYSNAASDGSEAAAAILYTDIPGTASGDKKKCVVIVRNAEVFGSALTGNDANGTADLKALNIIVR